MDKRVSIITPCYNGASCIPRLLDSILAQTYPNIEMLVVDDGSTDRSAEIIRSYIPAFETKGYSLAYLYQENSGQSVAINKGLKWMKGDYLVWPDSDDYYAAEDAIEKMVAVLDTSDDTVSMVRSQSILVDEIKLEETGRFGLIPETEGKVDLFEDCLLGLHGFWYPPGEYMAKISKIDELIPSREIYTEKDAGQNWQLYLPLLYQNKCLTIKSYIYHVLVRENSHSRGQYSGQEQILRKYATYRKTLLETLDTMANMPDEEKDHYKRQVMLKYDLIRFNYLLKFKRFGEARTLLRDYPGNNFRLLCKYYLYRFPFTGNIMDKRNRKK